MQKKKKTFRIKHNVSGHYICNVDFDDLYEKTSTGAEKYPGVIYKVGIQDFKKKIRNYCQYFREEVCKEDKKKILIISNISEPVTFYFDKPYLKCSKTHKYFCSTELKYECGGGSFPFLSYSKNCAVEFPEFKSGFIYYKKSLVYPGRGMPDYALTPKNLKYSFNCSYNGGGHINVPYNISENINMMSVYHTTNYKPNYGFTQEFITDNNNKEILITSEDHSDKAIKVPLEKAIKSAWDAHYQLAKSHLFPSFSAEETEKISRKCADDASEKRRQQ
tara:strand:- start:2408 stop:3235 length:828 start_codon:yes stop_codon:yes gene_type:complete